MPTVRPPTQLVWVQTNQGEPMSDDIWRKRDDTTGGAKTPDYGTDYGAEIGRAHV